MVYDIHFFAKDLQDNEGSFRISKYFVIAIVIDLINFSFHILFAKKTHNLN